MGKFPMGALAIIAGTPDRVANIGIPNDGCTGIILGTAGTLEGPGGRRQGVVVVILLDDGRVAFAESQDVVVTSYVRPEAGLYWVLRALHAEALATQALDRMHYMRERAGLCAIDAPATVIARDPEADPRNVTR